MERNHPISKRPGTANTPTNRVTGRLTAATVTNKAPPKAAPKAPPKAAPKAPPKAAPKADAKAPPPASPPRSDASGDLTGMSERVAAALGKQYWSESTSTTSTAPGRDEAPSTSSSEGGPSGVTAPFEPPRSTLDQPGGDINCSVYAPMCAYQLCTGQLPDVSGILKNIGNRLGGNSNKAFENLCGYGLAQGEAYSETWRRMLVRSTEERYPAAIAVEWRKGARSGNHWVYYVGEHGGKLYARDQQNKHHLITIDPASWKGSAEGGWSYKITSVGLGFPSRDAAIEFLKS